MKKLLLSFSIVMLTLFCSISAYAANVDDSGMWEYETFENGVELVKYNGAQEDVYVPNKISKGESAYSVLKLGDELFKGNTGINSATLGEGILEIGASAFEGSTNLVCIVTPESLTTIGNKAFSDCTSFNSVILYDTVTNIGENAFAGCSKITVYCNENKPVHSYVLANNIDYKILNPDAVPEIITQNGIEYYIMNGEAIAVGYDGESEELIIPSNVNGYPVTELRSTFYGKENLKVVNLPNCIKFIGADSFYNCKSLKNIDIPDSVTKIGERAFERCEMLEKIRIPNGVTAINANTFKYCRKLQNVVIPKGVTFIGNNSFCGCNSLTEIVIPNTVTTIEYCAFYSCEALKDVVLPENQTSYGGQLFALCTSIEEITIPQGMSRIPSGMFSECSSLKNVIFHDNVYSIDDYAFSGCASLENIVLPQKLSVINYSAFTRAGLREFVAPSSLYNISESVFENCDKLEYVDLGNVNMIENRAFYGCDSLRYIMIPWGVNSIKIDSFPENICLFIQENSYAQTFAENNSLKWYELEEYREYELNGFNFHFDGESFSVVSCNIKSGEIAISRRIMNYPVTAIESNAFWGNKITDVVIPEGIVRIGNAAFLYCDGIEQVTIPRSVTSMYSESFSSNTLLNVYKDSYAHIYAKENGLLYSVIGAPAPYEVTVDGVTYRIADGELRITGYDGTVAEVTICNEINGISVTDIGNIFSHNDFVVSVKLPETIDHIDDSAFYNCDNLRSIILPNGITKIGNYAFYECKKLENLSLPERLETIGNRAFYSCSAITEISVPGGVTNIPELAFYKCSALETVNLSEGLKKIGVSAFSNCNNLSEIEIPESVTEIGSDSFKLCNELKTIKLSTNISELNVSSFEKNAVLIVFENSYALNFAVENGLLYFVTDGKTEPQFYNENEIEYYINNGNASVIKASPSITEAIIPQSINNAVVTDIINAFCDNSKLRSVSLPEGLKRIGDRSFYGCTSLSSINIPETVEEIGETAFYNCKTLKNVVLPENITKLGRAAFQNSGLTSVEINGKITTIPGQIFEGTGIGSIIIPDGVTEIGSSAFKKCSSLTTVILPESLKKINSEAFKSCSQLKEILLPSCLEEIGYNAFAYCSNLENIVIPDSVAIIEAQTFYYCYALKSVVLPKKITEIPDGMFAGCNYLRHIELPKTVKHIGADAFYGSDLSGIALPEGIESIGSIAFFSTPLSSVYIPESVTLLYNDSFDDNTVLYVVKNSYAYNFVKENDIEHHVISPGNEYQYETLTYYITTEGYATIYSVPYDIDDADFEDKIPREFAGYPVTSIHSYAVQNANNITNVVIPDFITFIDSHAFHNCINLKTVTIPETVTNLSTGSFPENVILYVFENSYAHNFAKEKGLLHFVTDGITKHEEVTLGGVSYYLTDYEAVPIGCDKSISEVVIPEKVGGNAVKSTGIAFRKNSKIKKVTLPDSINKIPEAAFEGCKMLEEINLPESIEEIGSEAFEYCESLQSVQLPSGINRIKSGTFRNCTALTGINIPSGVAFVDNGAFTGCSSLSEVVLPEGLTGIGAAFSSCDLLLNVTIPKSVTNLLITSFHENTTLNVYKNSYAYGFAKENGLLYSVLDDDEQSEVFVLDGVEYRIINGEAVAVKYNGNSSNIVIPENVNGYPVTELHKTFENHTALESVILPQGLKIIGERAFSNCSKLSEIHIPDSVITIGEYAFYNTGLKEIEIYDNVTNIESSVFAGCRYLEKVKLPRNMTEIPMMLFDSCSMLREITFPENLQTIKLWAFSGCESLTDISFPKNMKTIESCAFENCTALKRVVLRGKDIGDNAFYGCSNLETVIFFEGLETIYHNAFEHCDNLKKVYLPDSLWQLENNSFPEDTTLYVSESCSAGWTIEEYGLKHIVVEGCTEIEIGGIIYELGWNTASVKSCGEDIAEVYILPSICGYTVDFICDLAFINSHSLKRVSIPGGIECIYSGNFNWMSIEYLELSEGLKKIESQAFTGNYIENIKIPKSVNELYVDSFSYDTVLCVYKDSYAHNFAKENHLLYTVIEESYEPEFVVSEGIEYLLTEKQAIVTGLADKSLTEIIIPETVYDCTVIGIVNGFENCKNIKKVTIPETVTDIGHNAFYGCSGLETVDIKGCNLKTIGNQAFNYCYSLNGISLHEGITKIGNNAFAGCKALHEISLPESLQQLGDNAFSECAQLTEILLPSSLTSIPHGCFSACTALEKINLQNISKISSYSFNKCYALTDVIIPGSVYEICSSAFSNCVNLDNLIISEGVAEINNEAFAGCLNLRNIKVPDSIIKMSALSFANNTILLVNENSYAHTFAEANNLLYFILHKTANPEISYGAGITGKAVYTDGFAVANTDVEILYDDGTLKEVVTTDANGNYSFTYAEVGGYTIRATDSTGNAASEDVSVKRMNVFDVYLAGETDLVLKKGYNVSGTVTPSVAKVTISNTNGNVIKSLDITNGTFAFTDIPRGSYIVKAENETGSATTEIYVSNEDVTGITLEIKAQSATITGGTKIENRDGTYSAKIWVNVDLIDADGNVVASTKTDADGKYTFNNVPAGNYNIVAITNEMRPAYGANFDKSFELKGYGHIEITDAGEYEVGTIILREEKVNLTSVSGKVTANGSTQDCQVILTNEDGDQVAVFITDKNGKYSFVNIPDGMYCITAITKADGMGYTVITIDNGVICGSTNIKVAKSDKVSKRETTLLSIPDCETKEEALLYKEAILAEKAFYDSLSEKERKQLSEEWIEKLFKLIGLISDSNVSTTEGVVVENIESIIMPDEIEETINFTLTVDKVTASEAGENGITSNEEYETEKIKDKKGKNKTIAQYYDITLVKDGQNISNIQKQTETNGKLRITMDIPEEYRGHKHYSFIHMHKGEAVTLVDLDDNPNTVTFEIDKFSTFALAYSDVDLIGEVEKEIYPANIIYNAETGKISVSSTENGTLYIATYNGDRLSGVVSYDVVANATVTDYDFTSNQVAFVWNEYQAPLCSKFTIKN